MSAMESDDWCVAVFKCKQDNIRSVLVDFYAYMKDVEGVKNQHFLIRDRVDDEVVFSYRVSVEPRVTLDEAQPFFGFFDPILPPVYARYRADYLNAACKLFVTTICAIFSASSFFSIVVKTWIYSFMMTRLDSRLQALIFFLEVLEFFANPHPLSSSSVPNQDMEVGGFALL
jgi:hypothetical protein